MMKRHFANLSVLTFLFVLGATVGYRCAVFQPPSYLIEAMLAIYLQLDQPTWQYMGMKDSAPGGILDTFCAIIES